MHSRDPLPSHLCMQCLAPTPCVTTLLAASAPHLIPCPSQAPHREGILRPQPNPCCSSAPYSPCALPFCTSSCTRVRPHRCTCCPSAPRSPVRPFPALPWCLCMNNQTQAACVCTGSIMAPESARLLVLAYRQPRSLAPCRCALVHRLPTLFPCPPPTAPFGPIRLRTAPCTTCVPVPLPPYAGGLRAHKATRAAPGAGRVLP